MRLNGERINFRAVISCALSCLLIALSFSGCSLIQNKYSISDKTEESAENSVENIIDAAEENIYDASGENTLDASEDTVNGVSENTLNNGYDEEITGVADTVSEGLNKKINLSLSECICLPQSQWQVDVSFPEWRGFADDTLALNDIMGFDYYSDQGKLYVAADPEVTSFDMYINDSKVDTSAFVGGKCYEVDFSKVSVNGRNSVQISNVMPFDYNKDTEELERVRVCIPYPTVIEGTPSEVGIADESLKLISDIIESDVENGFTSSQLAVIRQGKLVYQNAWGYTNSYLPDGSINPEKVPVTNDTLYDLASVTKMASVNLSIQKMVTDGTINLDDKIADYIGPEFYESVLDFGYKGKEYVSHETQVKWKSELTVRDILCHQAGFPADPMYHYIYLDASTYAASKNNTNILYSGVESNEDTKAKTLVSICKTPLMYEPGSKTVYSDVDYMLLGFLIEKVSGKDLNSYCKENFWEPMDLNNITFNPLKNGFDASDCAATELNGNTRDGVVDFPGIRNYTLQGEVHDEKAYYCMGGVSGHAGLFANATDLAKLMSTMLTGGYGEYSFYSENVIDAFTAPKDAFSASWGLGWWREGELQRVGFFGTDSGNSAFGHQGWTGTIVIIDPDKDLVIVYLTNKINSSLISKSSANRFRGGAYTAATLGFVPQILAIGMDGEGALGARLTSLTASMARESVRIIPDGAAGDNPYYANAKSKINVLKKWSDEYGAENETYYNDLINELNTELEERANN